MASSSVSTLKHVTMRKLKQLDDQREKFEVDKRSILGQVAAAPNPRGKVEVLLDGFKLYGILPRQADLSIANLRQFTHQAKHDPSVSSIVLQNWQDRLVHELDVASNKFEYAALFGRLVTEWINFPKPGNLSKDSDEISEEMGTEKSGSPGASSRRESHEQRAQWESYAFEEKKVDYDRIEVYLNDIFETAMRTKKMKKSPLQDLRDTMNQVMNFRSDLDASTKDSASLVERVSFFSNRFTKETLQQCIRGVRASDLFTGHKREILTDLEERPAALKELVDVLNLDLEGLDTWEWMARFC